MVAELLGRQAAAPRSQGSGSHRRRCVHHLPAVRSAGSLESAGPNRIGMDPDLSGLAPRIARRLAARLTARATWARIGHRAQPLAETIRRELSRWNLGAIEESIFGTADPDEMAAILDRYCRSTLAPAQPAGSSISVRPDARPAFVSSRVTTSRSRPTRSVGRRPTCPRSNRCRRTSPPKGSPALASGAARSRSSPAGPTWRWWSPFLADPGMEPLRGSEALRHSAAGLARQVVALPLRRPERALGRTPPYARRPGVSIRNPTVPSSTSTGPRPARLDRRLRGQSI